MARQTLDKHESCLMAMFGDGSQTTVQMRQNWTCKGIKRQNAREKTALRRHRPLLNMSEPQARQSVSTLWTCGCPPSDPSPGRWTRPMLSASDATTKTPCPSPPPPPSPSSWKVSEAAKEGMEFQESQPSCSFFSPLGWLGFAGDRWCCLASEMLSLGSVSGRERGVGDLSFSH